MHGPIGPNTRSQSTKPFTCEECGKQFWIPTKTIGRPKKFCSDRCRLKAFRYIKSTSPGEGTGCNETPPKTTATAEACKRVFLDRPTVDKALWRRIVEAERGWVGGREIVSSGGVRCFIVRERPRW